MNDKLQKCIDSIVAGNPDYDLLDSLTDYTQIAQVFNTAGDLIMVGDDDPSRKENRILYAKIIKQIVTKCPNLKKLVLDMQKIIVACRDGVPQPPPTWFGARKT